jgi:hypothetical protein
MELYKSRKVSGCGNCRQVRTAFVARIHAEFRSYPKHLKNLIELDEF